MTVEASLGGRDKKTRETPRGERVATKKKTCGALRAPQTCFFFRRDSRSPRGLTRFLSHGPPRTLVGAEAWVCRVSLGVLPWSRMYSLSVCTVLVNVCYQANDIVTTHRIVGPAEILCPRKFRENKNGPRNFRERIFVTKFSRK